MATAILGAMGEVSRADDYLIVGELSLDGSLRPVRGVLSIAVCAAKRGIANLLVPVENAPEAAVANGVKVFGLRHLGEVVQFLKKPEAFEATAPCIPNFGAADRSTPISATCVGKPWETRARSRRFWQSQCSADWASRIGQNHARPPRRRHTAKAYVSRGVGSDTSPQRRGRVATRYRHSEATSVPSSSSQHFGRGSDRRGNGYSSLERLAWRTKASCSWMNCRVPPPCAEDSFANHSKRQRNDWRRAERHISAARSCWSRQ